MKVPKKDATKARKPSATTEEDDEDHLGDDAIHSCDDDLGGQLEKFRDQGLAEAGPFKRPRPVYDFTPTVLIDDSDDELSAPTVKAKKAKKAKQPKKAQSRKGKEKVVDSDSDFEMMYIVALFLCLLRCTVHICSIDDARIAPNLELV
jgi:hypothetical protein